MVQPRTDTTNEKETTARNVWLETSQNRRKQTNKQKTLNKYQLPAWTQSNVQICHYHKEKGMKDS